MDNEKLEKHEKDGKPKTKKKKKKTSDHENEKDKENKEKDSNRDKKTRSDKKVKSERNKKKKKKKFDLLDILGIQNQEKKKSEQKDERKRKEKEKEKKKKKDDDEDPPTSETPSKNEMKGHCDQKEEAKETKEIKEIKDVKDVKEVKEVKEIKDNTEIEFNDGLKQFVEMMVAIEKKETISKFYNITLLRIPQSNKNFQSFFANPLKNRNGDIFCVEETRIKLKPTDSNTTVSKDYIHANWIKFDNLKRIYIATQHPMMNTLEDFWNMVFNENIENIVSLTNMTTPEFPQFFPRDKEAFINYGIYSVTCKSIKPPTHRHIPFEYKLEVLPNGCSNSIFVNVFQYQHWGKYLVPASPKILLSLHHKLKKVTGPVLVQCETGVNQSSVFIFFDVIVGLIAAKQTFTIESIFEKLRNQRCSMLSTRLQFLYSVYSVFILVKARFQCGKLDNKELVTAVESIEGSFLGEFGKSMSIEPHDAAITSIDFPSIV